MVPAVANDTPPPLNIVKAVDGVEGAPAGQHEAENTAPGGPFRGCADTMPEILVEMRRPPSPMGGDLLLYRVGSN